MTTRRLGPLVPLLAWLLCLSGSTSGSAGAQQPRAATAGRTKAVVGGTLIDGTGRPAVPNAVILIRDGRFVSIQSGANAAPAADAEVISARGKFIVPGFIDGHAHFRSWNGELCLNHGVTSVIDVGNPREWMLALRDGFAKGKIGRIPRIYASGNALSAVGEESTTSIRLSRPSTNNLEVSNVDAVRKAVVELLDVDELDFLSLFAGDFSPEMLKTAVDEAHKRGKRVVAHLADTNQGVYEVVRAGGEGVSHLYNVAIATLSPANYELFKKRDLTTPFARMEPAKVDELVAFLVDRHTYLTPELVYEQAGVTDRVEQFKAQATALLANPDLQQYLPADVPFGMISLFDRIRSYRWRFGFFTYKTAVRPADLDEFRTGYRNAQAFVRKFAKAGGKLEAGTDASGGMEIPGLNVLHEMQLLVDAGLTPMQALQAATINPAEAIGVGNQVGTIQPGRFADLVVLDADPLQNIDNIHKISMVMQGGEPVEPGYHWDYALPIPNPDIVMDTKMNGFNAVPQLYDVSPRIATEGDASATLKVSGAGFMTRSQLLFNGVSVPTRYESDRALTVEIPGSLLAKPGTYWVQVVNPPPGGGRSNPSLGFIVRFR